MKAVIMAGGEGTRLRPISSGLPKPMATLLERPLLAHIIDLLKSAGITDICTTLGYMPEAVTGYFGDGKQFGVNLAHSIERQPLGTAGGVLACHDFYGDEDFLVISGDAACDFDLSQLIDFHRANNPAVTMGLYSHPEPLQYGLVLTDKRGHVRSFIEKPPWERVITDCVNTGTYIVSSKAMSYVPKDRQFDFAKDLFPILMQNNESIMAVTLSGYWCDVGNPAAYHRCCMDALKGKLHVTPGVKESAPGIWCGSELPPDLMLTPPCVIGEDVVIESGVVIGPDTIIGRGSRIGSLSRIISSVIDGADIGTGAEVQGAVVCRGSKVPSRTAIEPGEVYAPRDSKLPPTSKLSGLDSPRKPMAYTRELACNSRAGIMRVLSEAMAEFGADFSDGLQFASGNTRVRISPCADKDAISIEADADKMETAAELCGIYEDIVRSYL